MRTHTCLVMNVYLEMLVAHVFVKERRKKYIDCSDVCECARSQRAVATFPIPLSLCDAALICSHPLHCVWLGTYRGLLGHLVSLGLNDSKFLPHFGSCYPPPPDLAELGCVFC